MTLQQIYDLGIEMAIQADPRGADFVKKQLTKAKKEYEKLPEKKKKYFDLESLHNPYSDSRIFNGDPKIEVKKILAGIDADAAEVLLFDRLNQKGSKFDLLISHHPSGHALAALHDVMDLQIDVYAKTGVPINVADSLMKGRMAEIQRKISPSNHNQAIDAARLLEVPFLGLHTIWDNLSNKFMTDYVAEKEKEFDTVGELFEYINEIPEFIEAIKGKNGPAIVSGSENSRLGKIAVFFTGGTNPAKEMYMEWAKAGIGTVIDMHIPEDALEALKKLHVNVINTGHMASDSIGANIFFDVLQKKGVAVVAGAGFIRVQREGKSK